MKQHSILPPSSADKWMECHGWYRATEGLPNKSSIYAEEGAAAHEILESCLRLDLPPSQVTQDIDLALNLSTVTDWLAKYRKENPKADYIVEHWVSWGQMLGKPELGGTIDLGVIDPVELVVGDYKHGIGVIVEPLESKQLRLYLLGMIQKYGKREQYRLVIFQPRARHEDGPIRDYIVSHKELKIFAKWVQNAVEENLSEEGGERQAGDHCRFCIAAGSCKTLAQYSLKAAKREFSSASSKPKQRRPRSNPDPDTDS